MSIQAEQATEGSNIVLTAKFYDSKKKLVTPTSIKWSLFGPSGEIVNERSGVDVTPDEEVTIVICGADLPDPGDEKGFYVECVITALYTESGRPNTPEKKPVRILIEDVPTEAP